MDPITPSTAPLDTETIKRALRLSALPGQEKIEREKMAMMQALFPGGQQHHVSGALPAALWGAGDAVGKIAGAYFQRKSLNRLQALQQEGLESRRALFDAANGSSEAGARENFNQANNPSEDPGVPEMLRRPDQQHQDYQGSPQQGASALRRRGLASALAMTGDPAMEKSGERMMQEQQLDREYAQMQQQLALKDREFKMEQDKFAESKRHTGVEEQNQTLGMHGFEVKPVPDLGGVIISNKLGDSWLHIPGQAPIALSKGVTSNGPGKPVTEGGPVVNAAGNAGGDLPHVKETEAEMQAKTRATGGASGLLAALSYGFPSTGKLSGLRQQGSWIAAAHGFPAAATDVDQLRAASWNSVFDLEARERAGLRIPEELRSQMRQELRVTPGEPWQVQVAKTKQVLGIFRTAASSIKEPTARSRVNAELNQVEQMLPRTKQDFDNFNKAAADRMKKVKQGGSIDGLQPGAQPQPQASAQPMPQSGPTIPTAQPVQLNGVPQPGPQAPAKPPLADRLKQYGWE